MARQYPERDLKLLWGLSAGRCAFPGCYKECIHPKSEFDRHAIVGKIAHIEAHSDKGPRANPNLTPKERDCYDNWLLLCANHHDLVDQQPDTYTVTDLRNWKNDLENRIRISLTDQMLNVTFQELEWITQVVLRNPLTQAGTLVVTPPFDKMKKNGLTQNVHQYISMGMIQTDTVEKHIRLSTQLMPNFQEKLRAGFVIEYLRLKNAQRLSGDGLFFALLEFASSGSKEFSRQAAGLAVLTYLFTLCEVFEP